MLRCVVVNRHRILIWPLTVPGTRFAEQPSCTNKKVTLWSKGSSKIPLYGSRGGERIVLVQFGL